MRANARQEVADSRAGRSASAGPRAGAPGPSHPAISRDDRGGIVRRKASCACGGSCPRCGQQGAAASKYQISTPGDSYEQEADRVADAVMSPAPPEDAAPVETGGAPPSVQRKCGGGCGGASPALMPDEEEKKLLQPKGEAGQSPPQAAEAEAKIDDSQGGQPLAPAARDFFEPRFGQDFGGVRVHADERAAAAARSVNAEAYTLGRDIYFGAGRYRPDTSEGRHLLAHELAHVVQQGGSAARISRRERDSAPATRGGPEPPRISTNAPRHVQRGNVANCYVPTMTDNVIGMTAHGVIQSWCASQYPFCFSEVGVAGAGGVSGTGFADLVHTRPGSTLIEIGEIKPVSQSRNVNPYVQLASYITAYQASHPQNQVLPMTGWVPSSPPNGVTPFLPPPGQQQFLNCSASTNGVYFYWCTRTAKPPDWVPVPVPVPREVWDRVREAIRQMRERARDLGQPEPEPTRVPRWVWAAIAVAAAVIVVALAIALLPAEIVAGIGAALLTLGRILLGAAPRLAGFAGAFGLGMGAASASTGEGGGEGAAEGTGGQGQRQGSGTQGGSQTEGTGGQGQTPGTGTTPGEAGTAATTPPQGGTPGAGTPGADTSVEQAVNGLASIDPSTVQGTPQAAQSALDQAAPAMQSVQAATGGAGTEGGAPATGATAEISREAAQVSTAVDAARREASARAGASGTGTPSAGGTPSATPGQGAGGSTRGPAGQGAGDQGGVAGPLPSTGPTTTYTPASTIPEGGRTRTDFGIWIISGMDRNAVPGNLYTAVVRIELTPPFTVPVLFRVESKEGNRVVLTVARAWYVAERNVGSPVGARYTYTFPSRR